MALVEAIFPSRLFYRFSKSPSQEKSGIKLAPQPGPVEPELLGEQIIYEKGSLRRVRRYYRGWYPNMGPLSVLTSTGWQGQETIVEMDAVRPVRTFMVEARANGRLPINRYSRPWAYLTKVLSLF